MYAMSNKLESEIEVILVELGKILSSPAVLSDFQQLFSDINSKSYLSVVEDVIKLAADIVASS
jgi:hypothetical protein